MQTPELQRLFLLSIQNIEERKNLFDVEDTCISLGGHLPSVDTWDINNYMMRTKISEWTGASDLSKEGEKKEKLGRLSERWKKLRS